MAQLTEPVQIYIVTALATYTAPTEVIRQVRDVFGVEAHLLQVIHYDASRPYYKGAKRWADLFHETRKLFLQRAARDGLARQEVRLTALERLAAKAEERGNLKLAADIYRQAAEDAGGLYTNVRMVKGDPQTALAQLLGVQPSEIPNRKANHWAAGAPAPPPEVRRAAVDRAAGVPLSDTILGNGNGHGNGNGAVH